MVDEKKIAFRITDEQAAEIDRVKQVRFYNKSYADLYRYLIDVALETLKKGNQ